MANSSRRRRTDASSACERYHREQGQQRGEERGEDRDPHEVLDVLRGDVLQHDRAEVVLESRQCRAPIYSGHVTHGEQHDGRVGLESPQAGERRRAAFVEPAGEHVAR